MKLLKLTIKNISSIPEAEISFSEGPLSETDLFLICGQTGAGKSTILDSICLALYGQVPRMGTSKYRKGWKEEDELDADDLLLMLRKHADQGSASLEFQDLNDIRLIATFRMNRKVVNKRKGQPKTFSYSMEHELCLAQTEEVVATGAEVRQEVRRRIGLDYSQFCRTTLLAQNDFDKFLKSGEDEKSAILEKITGVSIFSAIGKKLNEIKKRHEDAATNVANELKGIVMLTSQEREDTSAQIAELRDETARLAKVQEEAEHQLTWLKKSSELEINIAGRQKEEAELSAKIDTDEYRSQTRMIADYDTSTEARAHVLEAEKLRARLDGGLREEGRHIRAELGEILGAFICADREAHVAQAAIADKEHALEEWRPRAVLLGQYTEAMNLLSRIETARKDAARHSDEVQEQQKSLPEAIQEAKTCEETLQKANTELQKVKDQLTPLEQQAAENPFTEITNKVTTLGTRLTDLENVSTRITHYAETLEVIANATSEREKVTNRITELQTSLTANQEQITAAEDRQTRLQADVDQKKSDQVKAMELRQRLKVGCPCPVCTQTVRELVEIESLSLSREVTAAQSELEQATAALTALKTARDKLNTEQSTERGNLLSVEKNLKEQQKIEKKQKEEILKTLDALSLSPDALTNADIVDEALSKTRKEKDAADSRLEVATPSANPNRCVA